MLITVSKLPVVSCLHCLQVEALIYLKKPLGEMRAALRTVTGFILSEAEFGKNKDGCWASTEVAESFLYSTTPAIFYTENDFTFSVCSIILRSKN